MSCDKPYAAGFEIGSADGYDDVADEALTHCHALDRVRQAFQFDYRVI